MRKTITISDILRKKSYMKAHLKLIDRMDLYDLTLKNFSLFFPNVIDFPSRRAKLCEELCLMRPDLTKYAIQKALKLAHLKRVQRRTSGRLEEHNTMLPDLEGSENAKAFPASNSHQSITVQSGQIGSYRTISPVSRHFSSSVHLNGQRLFPLRKEEYDGFAVRFWRNKGCPLFKKQHVDRIVWGFPHLTIKMCNVGNISNKLIVTNREIGVYIGKKTENKFGIIFLVD